MSKWMDRSLAPPDLEPHFLEPQTTECPAEIAEELGRPYFLANLLWKRGYTNSDTMQEFLTPQLSNLDKIDLSPSIKAASMVIVNAIRSNVPIAIWGDYDVDGVTSTSLVYKVLSKLCKDVTPYLPNRHEGGYGIEMSTFRNLPKERRGVLITVDCGVSEISAVRELNSLGYTVVITDHHLPKPELPEAAAIVNPKVDPVLFHHLAGVGVALYTMCGVAYYAHQELNIPHLNMLPYLEYAAIGSIADMVPLIGDNRIIAKNGLIGLRNPSHVGIAALKIISRLTQDHPIAANDVNMVLAPRINAVGRMGSPIRAFELLVAEGDEIHKVVHDFKDIAETNELRKEEEKIILDLAMKQVRERKDNFSNLLVGDDWHIGVTGIVASKIVRATGKPTILMSKGPDGAYRGTGRSVQGFDLFSCLEKCAHLFRTFGGHKQAAGLTIEKENISTFLVEFEQHAKEACGGKHIEHTFYVDMPLSFTEIISPTILQHLELMHPYGIGNPEPVFQSSELKLERVTPFGINKDHVRLLLREISSNILFTVQAWDASKAFTSADIGRLLKMLFKVGVSNFRSYPTVEINMEDWQYLTAS